MRAQIDHFSREIASALRAGEGTRSCHNQRFSTSMKKQIQKEHTNTNKSIFELIPLPWTDGPSYHKPNIVDRLAISLWSLSVGMQKVSVC